MLPSSGSETRITRATKKRTQDAIGVSTADAWAYTRRLSPRGDVRVATHVVDGTVLNVYDVVRDLNEPAPSTPWAMHLADEAGYYRWLGFDFDTSHGDTRRDSAQLERWLHQLGIASSTYISGPSGGRHVWVKADNLHPALVTAIASRARSLLPSLDVSPLTNARTGALRPPLSPHRLGGVSQPIVGAAELADLPRTTTADAEALITMLDALGAESTIPMTAGIRGMAIDGDGHPHIAGVERQPSARINALITNGDPLQPDKSRLQATVLAGLARAHWRFGAVRALLDTSPALEHSRTVPVRATRVPRSTGAAVRVLRTAWALAVRYVALNPTSGQGDDEDFADREAAVVADVQALQTRAEAQPGRWGIGHRGMRRGRPSERAVLDAMCLYALQAVRGEIEVDVRRLAADTGYGRESCRVALTTLAEDGWISRTAASAGVHGATYRLRPSSTASTEQNWSQVVTRPAPPRVPLLQALSSRLSTLATDAFCAPRSLGRAAGRTLRVISDSSSATEIATQTGDTSDTVRRNLGRLHAAGLIERAGGKWRRSGRAVDDVARERGVDGFLAARAIRYDLERQVWAWWSAEVSWMRARRPKRGRRPDASAAPVSEDLDPGWARYPRRAAKKPDHAYARLLVEERLRERRLPHRLPMVA